jgi:hypothetical protein
MLRNPPTRATVATAIAAILAVGLAAVIWFQFFHTEPLRLFSPLLPGEASSAAGTPIYLDDQQVGKIGAVADELVPLDVSITAHQRRNLKEGMRRVVGTHAIFLSTEFVDQRGAPLINGDIIPAITPQQRELRRWWKRLDKWLLPATGAGALLCIRWLFRRRA